MYNLTLYFSHFTKTFGYPLFNIRSLIKGGCVLKYAWMLGLTFNGIFASLVTMALGKSYVCVFEFLF